MNSSLPRPERQNRWTARSALIREAVTNWFGDRASAVERWVAGYTERPGVKPDQWSDFASDGARQGRALAQRLDAEEVEHGLEW